MGTGFPIPRVSPESSTGVSKPLLIRNWSPNSQGAPKPLVIRHWSPNSPGAPEPLVIRNWSPNSPGVPKPLLIRSWSPNSQGVPKPLLIRNWSPSSQGVPGIFSCLLFSLFSVSLFFSYSCQYCHSCCDCHRFRRAAPQPCRSGCRPRGPRLQTSTGSPLREDSQQLTPLEAHSL